MVKSTNSSKQEIINTIKQNVLDIMSHYESTAIQIEISANKVSKSVTISVKEVNL